MQQNIRAKHMRPVYVMSCLLLCCCPCCVALQAQVKATQSAHLPTFTDAERKLLRRSYDYMGLTIYTGKYASEVPGNPNGWWVRTTDVNGK